MKKIFIIFFIYLIQYNIVLADTNIVFIDMDRVISTSKAGSSIVKQLSDINKKNSSKFKNDAKMLQEKETKLISQKNILSDVEFQSNVNNLKLEIKRNSAHYLFKIIIPVFLILCVAWSVLWIPTYKLDARLTTSIVALLSLIAYNFVFEGDIPKLDYLTDLDKYILLSYIFCCIPTFISIGFSRFIQRTAKMQRRVTKVNAHIRKWGGVIYLLITFQIFYSVN